ncbi:MAG TPA: hypothetical protein ENL09_00735, partial [Bacteroidetes bacterium]|nr:hypothetical protein [Bacteroidota bacterium]
MKKLGFIAIAILLATNIQAQKADTSFSQNAANTLLQKESRNKLTIGTYAQIDYNQQVGDTVRHNGTLDVHRLVLLLAYKFSEKTSFVTEIEFEHVKEVFIEQAFLNIQLNDWINLRGGLMLVPMGIINEYHEPTTFLSVERPLVDKYIVPTTWREIGLGIAGHFRSASVGYQLYVFNGFLGYDGSAKFRGVDGYRKGRQKAAKSVFTFPNLSAKIDYYGVPGLKIGLAGYIGKSGTTSYNNLNTSDDIAVQIADSSVVSIAMVGLDARYRFKNILTRGQLIYSSNKNTAAYNVFGQTDLGSVLMGYYLELGYNFWSLIANNTKHDLIPFVRYEYYNTQQKVYSDAIKNPAFNRSDITFGISFKIVDGAVVKADYQIFKNGVENSRNVNV